MRKHLSVGTYTHHQHDSPQGTSVDEWRKTENSMVKCQSKVSQEWYVQASRPGLDQGLRCHHRAQVEGVEGLGNVHQVMSRKGSMPAPCTCLQHLVNSEVLEKKRRSNTTSLPSSRGRNMLCQTRELVGM